MARIDVVVNSTNSTAAQRQKPTMSWQQTQLERQHVKPGQITAKARAASLKTSWRNERRKWREQGKLFRKKPTRKRREFESLPNVPLKYLAWIYCTHRRFTAHQTTRLAWKCRQHLAVSTLISRRIREWWFMKKSTIPGRTTMCHMR